MSFEQLDGLMHLFSEAVARVAGLAPARKLLLKGTTRLNGPFRLRRPPIPRGLLLSI
jgi:hypothetical protein